MTKLTLSLSALLLIAGVSVASADSGAPHVNGRDMDKARQIVVTAPGYSTMYEGRATAMDPAAEARPNANAMPDDH